MGTYSDCLTPYLLFSQRVVAKAQCSGNCVIRRTRKWAIAKGRRERKMVAKRGASVWKKGI